MPRGSPNSRNAPICEGVPPAMSPPSASGASTEYFAEQFVAPAEEEVAEQDGGGAAELVAAPQPAGIGVGPFEEPVGRRGPASRVGTVDDVVVDEGGGVEEFQRRGRRDDGTEVALLVV